MKRNLFSKLFRNREIDVEKTETLLSSLAPKVLTRTEDIEKIQPYLDKLKESINTKGISNIALTGGYGSGKSTIIGTFKELNPKYEYLNISLASFNKKEDDNEISSAERKIQKEEIERLLEVSILQQIFYHVKPQQIPESRFKRIDNISSWRIFGISVAFILWVISTTLLLKYNYLDKIDPTNWNTKDNFDWWSLPIFFISLTGLGILSKLVINLFSNSKISKVNIKGELELGDNINKSVFNEHLEEILYFFERTKYNVVIIEDLDRFDSTDIFTKLREINILLNNSLLIDREINFVYAVGDDLFKDRKERVKFFEYIVPVIPFVNSSNADEQLSLLIKESGLNQNIFTKDFISDITTFIDDIDMRLLTNIFQEFVIYRKTLKPEFIKKSDELFAIITYKNLYPTDFTLLGKKKGKLYDLINNKKNYIESIITKIDEEIAYKTIKIDKIGDEAITDIKELKNIYFLKILSKLPANALIDKLVIGNDFDDLVSKQKLSYKYHSRSYSDLYDNDFDFKFSEIENEVNPKFTYEERVELIESKQNNKINSLKNDIDKLKSKKSQIQNWDLKQIFIEVDVNQYLDDFSDNKLLRNLILNGYINENYNDYISLFHEVSITKEDFAFERNVKSGYATEFNYKLKKIETLTGRIDLRYFSRETILNFDLVDFLGNNYSSYSKKYDAVIFLLSNEKTKSIQFIDEFIDENKTSVDNFIIKLIEEWKSFWETIYWDYGNEKIIKYVKLIIRYVDVSTFINNQNGALMKDFINQNSDNILSVGTYLHRESDQHGELYGLIRRQIINYLKELDIKFEEINNDSDISSELLEYIYFNNHYEINENNISKMLLGFGGKYEENECKQSNYSAILNSECYPLIEYINSDINTYAENVYLKIEENKFEKEENLVKLLNNEKLDKVLKIKIIQKVETKIVELNKINDLSIKAHLLLNNKVIPKWNNVIDYYTISENIINDNLIEYLEFENVNEELSKIKLIKENELFEKNILLSNEITYETYKKLLDSIYFRYNKLEFETLDEDKVVSLANRILTTTKSNYDLLREHFPNNHIILIERDFKKFIEKISEFDTDEDDVLLILKSNKISLENKFDYINKLEESTITLNKETSKLVGEIILQKSNVIELSVETLKSVVINLLGEEKRIKLINLYFEKITNDDITKLLSSIWNYDNLFKSKKPTFNKTEYNRILLERLKSKGLIKNYYDNKWNDKEYRVTTNY